jgi:uncharacterized protein YhaN
MFYGFENESKRSTLENERRRYKPWQGGVYGGSLAFETNGKTYIVTRIFGEKEKDDIFELRDAVTNLEIQDFSKNIGEELFQIDGASFKRTVFVFQNDCRTQATDRVNAKLGNLAEYTDDMNRFETVDTELKDWLNAMSPTRKTGVLYKEKEKIKELEVEAKSLESLEGTIESLKEAITEQNHLQELCKKEQLSLQKQQQELSVQKDVQALKERYKEYVETTNERKLACEKEKAWFTGDIPVKEELEQWIAKSTQLAVKQEAMEIYREPSVERLEYFKQRFGKQDNSNIYTDGDGDVVDLQLIGMNIQRIFESIQEQITEWNTAIEQQKSLREQEATLREKEMALRQQEALLQKQMEQQQQETAAREEEQDRKQKKNRVIDIVFILVMVFVGIVGSVVGIGIAVVSTIGYYFFVIKKRSGLQNVTESDAEQMRQTQELIQVQKKEHEQCLKNIERITQEQSVILQMKTQVFDFLKTYGICCTEESEVLRCFYDLKMELKEYEELLKQKNQYQQAKYAYVTLREEICEYIQTLSMQTSEQLQEQLLEIQRKLHGYQVCKKEWEQAKTRLEQFEKQYPNIAECLALENQTEWQAEQRTLEELHEQLNEVAVKIETAGTNIRTYEKQLEELQVKQETIMEQQEIYERLKLQYEERLKKYRQISKTREFLAEAKLRFTSKYMAPLRTGFRKYFQMITKQTGELYQLDANTKLLVQEQGILREPEFFSSGYQDLTGICMRMAFIDAMYKEEKPFVLFDDPFVNLDDKNMKGALDFLQEIGKEYQILYFTCHEERCVE